VKETRRKSTHNRFFPTVEGLKQQLVTRFNRFQGKPASLRNVLASFAQPQFSPGGTIVGIDLLLPKSHKIVTHRSDMMKKWQSH